MREKAKKVMESRSWLPAPASRGGLRSGGASGPPKSGAVFRHRGGVPWGEPVLVGRRGGMERAPPARSGAPPATGLGGGRGQDRGDTGCRGIPEAPRCLWSRRVPAEGDVPARSSPAPWRRSHRPFTSPPRARPQRHLGAPVSRGGSGTLGTQAAAAPRHTREGNASLRNPPRARKGGKQRGTCHHGLVQGHHRVPVTHLWE